MQASKAGLARQCRKVGTARQAVASTLPSSVNVFAVNPTAKTIRYNLTMAWQTRAPDGFSRPTITINGQMPGPTIRCRQGDRLIIQ